MPPGAPGQRPRLLFGVRGPWDCGGHQSDAVINQLRASSCMLDTCTGTGKCLAAARLARVRVWLRFGPTLKAGGQARPRHVDERVGGWGRTLAQVVLDWRRGQLTEARAARGAGSKMCAPP